MAMAKKILIALIIILIIMAAIAGGYYAYVNYFIVSKKSESPGGPKSVYIEYLNKVNETKILEDIYELIFEYGYFGAEEQKNQTYETNMADLKKIPLAQKVQELKFLKNMSKGELVIASQLIETIDGDNAALTSPDDPGLIVNMIKEEGAWKIDW